MFIVGALGGAVVGIIAAYDDHSDHSDYSDYSEYSDAHMTAKIQQKEKDILRLQQQVRECIQEEISNLRLNSNIGPLINEERIDVNEKSELEQLSKIAVEKLEEKLYQEISRDKAQLQEIDQVIQKINSMTLTEKS